MINDTLSRRLTTLYANEGDYVVPTGASHLILCVPTTETAANAFTWTRKTHSVTTSSLERWYGVPNEREKFK